MLVIYSILHFLRAWVEYEKIETLPSTKHNIISRFKIIFKVGKCWSLKNCSDYTLHMNNEHLGHDNDFLNLNFPL